MATGKKKKSIGTQLKDVRKFIQSVRNTHGDPEADAALKELNRVIKELKVIKTVLTGAEGGCQPCDYPSAGCPYGLVTAEFCDEQNITDCWNKLFENVDDLEDEMW